jgi:GT2 family glycosyltransferase
MAEVVVAIPTFRRPESLKRLLQALAELATSAKVRVIVADNDAEFHRGFDLCQSLRADNYRWPLEAVMTPERGIAQARNALVARALHGRDTDFIAMLDDDEWPHPAWLEALLRMQRQTGADAVQGRIVFEYEKCSGPQTVLCERRAPKRRPNGHVKHLHGTGNLLLARSCFENMHAPYFDPAFALTGGEDADFFARLQQAGKIFAWADDAVAYEYIPLSRAKLWWALSRAYSIGNSDMRVALKYSPGLRTRLRESVKIAGALFVAPLLLLMFFLSPDRRISALSLLFRAAGKTAAMMGRNYNEYKAVHGG